MLIFNSTNEIPLSERKGLNERVLSYVFTFGKLILYEWRLQLVLLNAFIHSLSPPLFSSPSSSSSISTSSSPSFFDVEKDYKEIVSLSFSYLFNSAFEVQDRVVDLLLLFLFHISKNSIRNDIVRRIRVWKFLS